MHKTTTAPFTQHPTGTLSTHCMPIVVSVLRDLLLFWFKLLWDILWMTIVCVCVCVCVLVMGRLVGSLWGPSFFVMVPTHHQHLICSLPYVLSISSSGWKGTHAMFDCICPFKPPFLSTSVFRRFLRQRLFYLFSDKVGQRPAHSPLVSCTAFPPLSFPFLSSPFLPELSKGWGAEERNHGGRHGSLAIFVPTSCRRW